MFKLICLNKHELFALLYESPVGIYNFGSGILVFVTVTVICIRTA